MFSMTGYGSASLDAPFGKISIEIQSINGKFLDIQLSLPKELNRLDPDFRKMISEKVARGRVSLRFYLTPAADELFLPDAALLRRFKKGWELIATEVGIASNTIDLPFLLENSPALQKESHFKPNDIELIQNCLHEALDHLNKMRKQEGEALKKDLEHRLKQIQHFLKEVEKLTPNATLRIRQKFLEKMESLAANVKGEALNEQITRELFFYAERIDVTEEIIRLKSHLDQFWTALGGKKLEFLIQEMGREINTIGSKAQDAEIARFVVEMKGELEKMREQVQNIE